MIPRTVKMAKEVASLFSSTQLNDYGNIILNGYAKTGPNTTGKKAWQYAETLSAPVPLPTVTSVRPSLKGWTTNYMEYFTQLQPNAYGTNPGMPTNFLYNVHSFTEATGSILALGGLQAGAGYTPGSYAAVPAIGANGLGATLNVTVGPSGSVTACTLVAPGTGYSVGDGLTANLGPYDQPFVLFVVGITPVTPANLSRWAQCPRRFYQNQVAPFVPPNDNPQAIPYSFLYPVADSPAAPPIDILN